MTGQLAQLLAGAQDVLWLGFLVFLRVGAAMAVLPAFGERMVPMRVRLALTVVFTMAVLPAVADVAERAGAAHPPALLALVEVIAGLAIGLGMRLFVLALQTAGAIAAQSTSLSQIFGGSAVDPQPAFSHLLTLAGLALAASLGLHVKIAALFVLSYDLFPPGRLPDAGALADWGTARTSAAFRLAFALAAPFVIGSVLYNIALGVINRAMPQLMVALVGAPAITWLSIVLLMLAAPVMIATWIAAFDLFLADPTGPG